jgi:hypothetical protein
MSLSFTILRCVGFPKAAFDRMLYYEKHPKPVKNKAKNTSRKRSSSNTQRSPKKLARTAQKGKQKVKVEESGEESGGEVTDEEADDVDSEYLDEDSAPRQIAGLLTRASPRKARRAISVEL